MGYQKQHEPHAERLPAPTSWGAGTPASETAWYAVQVFVPDA